MHEQLKDVMPKENFESKFQLMFSLAHLPGAVLPLFTGFLFKWFGGRLCLLMLSSICLMGQIMTSLGVQIENWFVTLIGRFIFGLGFESLFATNQAFLSVWFKERELGMALGITSAASYVGFLLSLVIGPIIANRVTVAFSFWVGTIVKSVSVLATIGMFLVDRHCEGSVQEGRIRTRLSRVSTSDSSSELEIGVTSSNQQQQPEIPNISERHATSQTCLLTEVLKFKCSFWLLCLSCLQVYSISQGISHNSIRNDTRTQPINRPLPKLYIAVS
jgi:hypothetical protein